MATFAAQGRSAVAPKKKSSLATLAGAALFGCVQQETHVMSGQFAGGQSGRHPAQGAAGQASERPAARPHEGGDHLEQVSITVK